MQQPIGAKPMPNEYGPNPRNPRQRADEQDRLMDEIKMVNEDMGTNFMPTGALKAKGRALLVAAYDFWKEHQKVCGAWAVVWISDNSGKLVVFTRSEYRGDIMRNIQPLFSETPLDEGPDGQDPLTRARELLRETAKGLRIACRNAVWQDVILTVTRIEKFLGEGER
jgi:hypothetical protein